MKSDIKTNSFRAWVLAARPKTLTGAAVPVMIGVSLAAKDVGWENFQVIPAFFCFFFAFVMQIDANFINDYFDCIKGNDDKETRLGPKRACSEGWITLPAMRRGLIITTISAAILGLPLIIYGGLEMIIIGLVCVIFCFLYTTTLSYWGLGDLLVLIFFGIVPVCMSYYLSLPQHFQTVTMQVIIASIACGLVIDTLLVVNNYRDRVNDKRDEKMTLVVRIGQQNAERLYLLLGLIGTFLMAIAYLLDRSPLSFIAMGLLLTYFLFHLWTYKQMIRIKQGKELNKILGQTARNMFVYGVISTIGILFLAI